MPHLGIVNGLPLIGYSAFSSLQNRSKRFTLCVAFTLSHNTRDSSWNLLIHAHSHIKCTDCGVSVGTPILPKDILTCRQSRGAGNQTTDIQNDLMYLLTHSHHFTSIANIMTDVLYCSSDFSTGCLFLLRPVIICMYMNWAWRIIWSLLRISGSELQPLPPLLLYPFLSMSCFLWDQ